MESHQEIPMVLKVFAFYFGVVVLLLAGFSFGAVLLFLVQGTNIMSDPGDRGFAEFYLFCVPLIAALIAIPNGMKRFRKKELPKASSAPHSGK